MISIKAIFLSSTLILLTKSPCIAQIKVDTRNIKQPTKVNVKQSNKKRIFEFTRGTKRGKNIFHSFKKFNINSNEIGLFKHNKKNIKNIIIRISGKEYSLLNGLIDSGGAKNLVLMNPSGVYIKSGFQTKNIRSLNLTTANSIKFSDDFILSSNNLIKPSIINSSIDKLLFKNNSGIINIRNSGDILESNTLEVPMNLSRNESTLNVSRFGRIFVSAKEIDTKGALLFVQDGDIVFHTKKSGEIRFNGFDIDKKLEGSINIDSYTLLEASGDSRNNISLMGEYIDIKNGSTILLEDYSNSKGLISIQAKNLLIEGVKDKSKLSLTDSRNQFLSALRTRTTINAVGYNSANAPDIKIDAKDISILNGSRIANVQGDISIKSKKLLLSNGNNIKRNSENSILAGTFSSMNGGNINIFTNRLELNNGNSISTTTFSPGTAGNINISASNILFDSDEQAEKDNFIISATFGPGKTGDLNIKSNSINIQGGIIGSNSTGLGNTGDVNLDSNRINIKNSNNSITGIVSIINPDSFSEQDRKRFGIFDRSLFQGDIGKININANKIDLYNAGINVQNLGIGDGGTIKVKANKFTLKFKSDVVASTISGNGGNIFIDSDLLSLDDSLISSSTSGAGVGGRIKIKSFLATLNQQSKIQANAQNNRAGNISLSADTLLAGPGSKVTATSNLGPAFDGRIDANIQNTQIGKTSKLSPLKPIDTDVSQICGFDGNRLSIASKAQMEKILNDPDLISAWTIQQRYNQHQGQYFRDVETGEIKPVRPVLALEYQENGEFRSIHSPNESEYVSNLISSLERKCNSIRST